jgi:hypothetical protein
VPRALEDDVLHVACVLRDGVAALVGGRLPVAAQVFTTRKRSASGAAFRSKNRRDIDTPWMRTTGRPDPVSSYAIRAPSGSSWMLDTGRS